MGHVNGGGSDSRFAARVAIVSSNLLLALLLVAVAVAVAAATEADFKSKVTPNWN